MDRTLVYEAGYRGSNPVGILRDFIDLLLMRVTGALFPVTSGQDYVAGAPFSFALPRVILREKAKALSLTRTGSRRSSSIRKKHSTEVECFCFFVIRTGFEPVTHSLEGCCSIQLSYRTRPSFKWTLGESFSKVGAKIVIILGFAISFGSFVWVLTPICAP